MTFLKRPKVLKLCHWKQLLKTPTQNVISNFISQQINYGN